MLTAVLLLFSLLSAGQPAGDPGIVLAQVPASFPDWLPTRDAAGDSTPQEAMEEDREEEDGEDEALPCSSNGVIEEHRPLACPSTLPNSLLHPTTASRRQPLRGPPTA